MYKYRRHIVSAIAALLVLAMVAGIIVLAVHAESSSEIKERIDELKKQGQSIQAQKSGIESQLNSNDAELDDLVMKKSMIDQEIKLTQDSIENTNLQIQEYNLLIAEKQNELDEALAERDRLNQQYRARIRSMEENGKLTYWSILFKASSFSDMLDRVDMINEIALADSRMLERMEAVAQQIESSRQELAAEKVSLEEAKDQLAQDEAELEAKRAEADEVFAELWSDRQALEAAAEKYEAQQEALSQQIAQQEVKYRDAVAAEEEARRKAEEEARRKAEEEARRRAAEEDARRRAAEEEARRRAAEQAAQEAREREQAAANSGSSSTPSRAGFIWPVSCRTITCYYGPRIHPITGRYSNHNGIDIGASYGSTISAASAGTVTAAGFDTGYGYYVTINHGNGYTTLYGHMCRYIVSTGDYVTQGQTIGYVGSTGWSTGPHLHFTIYYNGATVNPLGYLP